LKKHLILESPEINY